MSINDLAISDKITHVFSDYFDTVVSRKCHPEEVKKRWCKKVIDFFNLNYSTEELYNIRLDIESELSKTNYEIHSEMEFRYADFLGRFISLLNLPYLDQAKEYLYNTELSIEKDVQYINSDVFIFLKKQKETGKKIIIVSDFYTNKEFIVKLIKYHGLSDIVDDIYISADLLKSKRSGLIYRFLLKEMNLKSKNVLMIGDNYHSDFINANESGIHAFHIQRDMSFYDVSYASDCNVKAIKKEFLTELNIKSSIFNWVSIPLYIFIHELYLTLSRGNVRDVIFLAREGEFLKELFDLYQEKRDGYKINTYYMYASRRGTYLPSLGDLNENTFDKILNQYPSMSLTALLKSLGLFEHLDRLKQSLRKEICFDRVHLNIKASEDYKNLINSSEFKILFEKEKALRQDYLKNYVNDLVSERDIHVVDVGWKGSIQDNIQKVVNRKVTGYYCGLLPNAKTTKDNVKYGLLFEFINNKCHGDEVFNEFRASFEVFCAASHGSLIHYISAPSYGLLEKNKYETSLYNEKIRPIQINLKLIVNNFINLENKYSLSFNEVKCLLIPIYKKKVFLPSSLEMNEFSSYKHYENFGVFNYSGFSIDKVSRLSYVNRLIKNPSLTIASEWWKPLGFKNNGMSMLKYPYFIYKTIVKRKGI